MRPSLPASPSPTPWMLTNVSFPPPPREMRWQDTMDFPKSKPYLMCLTHVLKQKGTVSQRITNVKRPCRMRPWRSTNPTFHHTCESSYHWRAEDFFFFFWRGLASSPVCTAPQTGINTQVTSGCLRNSMSCVPPGSLNPWEQENQGPSESINTQPWPGRPQPQKTRGARPGA